MVRIDNLSKKYGERTILDIQKLVFERAALHLLTGHNGSGKSTLLKIIASVDKEYSGTVECSAAVEEIVMCFQVPYMFCGTVWDNIVYGLRVRKQKVPHDFALELASRFGLKSLLRSDAKKLSGGEARKVAFVRSLVLNPKVLLLDEPTSDIDPECTRIVESEILAAVERGTTVIMATHHLHQARRLSGSVVRIENGMVGDADLLHNVFQVVVYETDSGTVADAGGDCRIHLAGKGNGNARICIMPTAIELLGAPKKERALNFFTGIVTEIKHTIDKCEVVVDIGIELWCVYPARECLSPGVYPGGSVCVTFDETAVKLL